jgi:hypothetical protein
MIQRKNVLAENMLRFGPKNLTKSQVASLRRIIEQATTDADVVPYKNPTAIEGFFTKTAAGVMPLAPKDAKTVIFATKLNPKVTVYGAASGLTNAIELPGTNYYLAVGQIGKVNNAVNPVVTGGKSGAILFFAEPAGTTAADGTSNGVVYERKFIAYTGNLAQFASDIVRATGGTAANKFDEFSSYEGKLASVLKASAGLGITGADKLVPSLDPTSYYAKWIQDTKELFAGPRK